MSYYLILDVGTTNIKAYAFQPDGTSLEIVEQKTKPHYPEKGWVEQDPVFVINAIHALIGKIQGKHGKCLGIGVTNQRSTTVVWDKKTGEPLYNMITWQDTRTLDIIEQLSKNFLLRFGKNLGKTMKGVSSLLPFIKNTKKGAYLITLANIGFGTTHCSMHLRWLLEHVPEVKHGFSSGDIVFGNIDSWVAWNLTKNHVTDYTNASSTGLFDPFYAQWSKNILKIVDLPFHILPRIIPNDTPVGFIKEYDIPLLTLIADRQASMYMAGVTKGCLSITTGTGAFVDVLTGTQPYPGDRGIYPLVALASQQHIYYLLEGSVNAVGSAFDWLLDIGFIKDYADIAESFKIAQHESHIVFIPPFSGLQSPYLRPDIKAAIFNITRDSTKHDFITALIQGIAMRCSEIIRTLENLTRFPVDNILVDGGPAKSNEFLQLIADLADKKMLRPTFLFGTAVGTFMLARSVYEKKDIVDSWQPQKIESTFSPKNHHDEYKVQWDNYLQRLIR